MGNSDTLWGKGAIDTNQDKEEDSVLLVEELELKVLVKLTDKKTSGFSRAPRRPRSNYTILTVSMTS